MHKERCAWTGARWDKPDCGHQPGTLRLLDTVYAGIQAQLARLAAMTAEHSHSHPVRRRNPPAHPLGASQSSSWAAPGTAQRLGAALHPPPAAYRGPRPARTTRPGRKLMLEYPALKAGCETRPGKRPHRQAALPVPVHRESRGIRHTITIWHPRCECARGKRRQPVLCREGHHVPTVTRPRARPPSMEVAVSAVLRQVRARPPWSARRRRPRAFRRQPRWLP